MDRSFELEDGWFTLMDIMRIMLDGLGIGDTYCRYSKCPRRFTRPGVVEVHKATTRDYNNTWAMDVTFFIMTRLHCCLGES